MRRGEVDVLRVAYAGTLNVRMKGPMSTIATTETNQAKAPAPAAKVQSSGVDAKAKGKAEATAFIAKCQALLQEGAELGNIALDEIASNLGLSANKLGRPTESAYVAFMSAMAHRPQLSYERRADLAKKANAAVSALHKPVAVIKAKAASTDGSASYRFNAPAKLEIALS